MLVAAGTTAYATAGLVGGSAVAALTTGPAALIATGFYLSPILHRRWRPVTQISTPEGGTSLVRGKHADEAKLRPTTGAEGWRLTLPHASGVAELEGQSALHAAGLVFAHCNSWGAPQKQVRAAVQELERVQHPEQYFATAAHLLASRVIAPPVEGQRYEIRNLPGEVFLALEMAANEEVERQALEGELRLLEAAWREAEEIAAIADTLLLRPTVERFIAKHRKS